MPVFIHGNSASEPELRRLFLRSGGFSGKDDGDSQDSSRGKVKKSGRTERFLDRKHNSVQKKTKAFQGINSHSIYKGDIKFLVCFSQ